MSLLTTDQVAKELQTTRQTVNRWINSGQLRAFCRGKVRRVDPADLERFRAASVPKGSDSNRTI